MLKSFFSRLAGLSNTVKIILGLILFTAVGAAAVPNNDSTKSINKNQQPVTGPQARTMTTKQVIETEGIDFAKKTEENGSIPKGQTQLKTAGEKGVKTLTYEVTYTDNVEISRNLVKEETTKAPIDEVTYVGTYVAPKSVVQSKCDPNYSGACVPIASDVDCAGGSGNGPVYVRGPVYVVGRDIYDLDRDGDGVGCEN